MENIKYVNAKTVACEGLHPENGMGHPRIFLTIDQDARAICPYCSRIFIYVDKYEAHHHGLIERPQSEQGK